MALAESLPVVRPLDEVPRYLDAAAGWVYREWSHVRLPSAGAQAALWRRDLELSGLPRHFVALVGDRPVGTASLVARDLVSRPQLTPWLANVVVDPAWRGRGAGTALVRAVEDEAAASGTSILYLHTTTAAPLYQRLGWQRLEQAPDGGGMVLVMRRYLRPPSRSPRDADAAAD